MENLLNLSAPDLLCMGRLMGQFIQNGGDIVDGLNDFSQDLGYLIFDIIENIPFEARSADENRLHSLLLEFYQG